MRGPKEPLGARALGANRGRWLTAGVLASALVLVSCGGGTESAAPASGDAPAESTSTSTSQATTTTTAPLTPEQEVLEAVAGYWRTYFEANDPANPSHPGFQRYYTGPARVRSVANAQNRADLSLVIRRGPRGLFASTATLRGISGDRASVTDCIVDDSMLVDGPSGRVLNDQVTTSMLRLDLVHEDGAWKVFELTEEQHWEAEVPQCR
jgi:hypothetical protein